MGEALAEVVPKWHPVSRRSAQRPARPEIKHERRSDFTGTARSSNRNAATRAAALRLGIFGPMFQTHQYSSGWPAKVTHHSHMQDKSRDGALLALRRQIIRERGDRLDHVEAQLRLRGMDMPDVCPTRVNIARRDEAQRIALDALGDGPQGLREVAAYRSAGRVLAQPRRRRGLDRHLTSCGRLRE